MTAGSIEDVAHRAGVSVDYVAELVRLGILVPETNGAFNDGHARRAAVVKGMEKSGVTLDDLGSAIRSGAVTLDFVDDAVYQRFATVSDVTFEQLCQRTGVPMELLSTVREAVGLPPPEPTDLVRDPELVVARLVEVGLAAGGTPVALGRLMRVVGDSMRRIAETEADWWYAEILSPKLARGLKGSDLAPDNQEEMNEQMDRAIIEIFHGRQAQTWMNNVTRALGGQMAEAGLHEQQDRMPAISFLDVTGYTRLTQERGDAAAADLAEQLTRIVQRSSAQHNGRPIKWLGDGVMFYFDDPADSVVASIDMVAAVSEAGLPPAHVGVQCGPVIFQEGDYFGQTVNLAARIADFARPGEVLVSQSVVDVSGGVPVEFTEIGPVDLKGVSGAVRLYSARLKPA